jgi:hypothetical protein
VFPIRELRYKKGGVAADENPKNKEAPRNGEAFKQQIKSPAQWPSSSVVSRCTAEHVAIKAELFHMDNCF